MNFCFQFLQLAKFYFDISLVAKGGQALADPFDLEENVEEESNPSSHREYGKNVNPEQHCSWLPSTTS